MENLNSEACVQSVVEPMDSATCTNFDYTNLSQIEVFNGAGFVIKTELGNTKKFNMDDLKEVPVTVSTTPLSSSFDSSQCSCDNMVIESHYKVYFSEELPAG
jgi:hypothetical protein